MNWPIGIALLVGAHQGVVALKKTQESHSKYRAAWEAARELGKPMLVVGGPYGSTLTGRLFGLKAHGCGDLCSDIDPRSCRGCPYEYGDVRELPFSKGQFGSVFCAHVLEHMPTAEDCARAWYELNRVADHVGVIFPGKDSLAGWATQGHHLWVTEVAQGVLRVEERHSHKKVLLYRDGSYISCAALRPF